MIMFYIVFHPLPFSGARNYTVLDQTEDGHSRVRECQ